MLLIYGKVEVKLKWTKHFVLAAAVVKDAGDVSNNIIFTIKYARLYVQKLLKILVKGFQRSAYWNEYQIKSENKNTTNVYKYFLELNFVGVSTVFVLVY